MKLRKNKGAFILTKRKMTCREIKTKLWICNDLTYGREPFYRNRALEGKSQNKKFNEERRYETRNYESVGTDPRR